jgi:gamma-glutamylcyclotransferase (GGCT)/AIG2-like uncharacterized protein YtfP
MTLVGTGSVPGLLYRLGSYAGAVLDPGSPSRIHGSILALPPDPAFLDQLDGYEEYFPADPGASLYLRILHPVTLFGGGALDCWVYVYNRPVGGAPVIEDGVFRG